MRVPAAVAASAQVLRQAGRSTEPGNAEAPAVVHETLASRGQQLDDTTRGYFERRFDRDFSQVRVHTDERAAASARALNASAYTVGPHIAFAAGRFSPTTREGHQLIAHELAHVVQQDASGVPLVQRDTFTPSSSQATIVKASKTTNEVKESVKTYCYEILRDAGQDPDTWYSNFTTTSFLGITVANVHNELANHLRERETFFLGKYGGNAETARKTLGLIDMAWAGARDFPTSAPISMHLFGLAVDVNYNENPFISSSANKVFARAGVMSDGTAREYHDGMTFEQLDALNSVLLDYFHFLDWNDLRGRLAELGDKAPAEFKGKSEEQVKALIQKDINDLGVKWERTGDKNKIRDFGFMRLTKEFKEGIGLAWGGSYGDMMHFDMRNAKGPGQHGAAIQGAIGAYLAKKKAEAKKVDADNGHGDSATQ